MLEISAGTVGARVKGVTATVRGLAWSCLAGAVVLAGCLVPPRAPTGAGATVAAAPPGERPLAVILERAGAYALRYGESFRNLTAEERYRQWTWGEHAEAYVSTGYRERTLRSDVVFVRLAGPIPWCTFRDVYRVDGRKVRDRGQRLEHLFASPSPSSHDQARAILEESSRYNLGPEGLYRNVNAPTIALLFLLPENQARLSFERRGRRTVSGFPTVEIAFQERTRPTLVRDRSDHDVPARGRFWIDPVRGTVLRTEVEYDGVDGEDPAGELRAIAWVSTKYRRESALDIVVPETMREWYQVGDLSRVDGRARYSKYRRFRVTSDWEVAGQQKPGSSPGPAPRGMPSPAR